MGTVHNRDTYHCETCGLYIQRAAPLNAPTGEELRHASVCSNEWLRPVYKISAASPRVQLMFEAAALNFLSK